jgi:hypothetical protein
MRLVSALLTGLLLLGTSGLTAAGERSIRSLPEPARASTERPEMPLDRVLQNGTAPRFFYSLAGQPLAAGSHELRFQVLAAGKLVCEDLLRLPTDAAGATFELLAGNGAWRQKVADLAATSRPTEVQVLLDGRRLRTFSLPEFLDYNRLIQLTPFTLEKPVAETWSLWPIGAQEKPSPGEGILAKAYDSVCWNNCDSNRQWCYQTDPSCAEVDWCDVCENQFQSCLNYCVICTDPKNVYYRDQYSAGNPRYAGSSCILNWDNVSSNWYDLYSFTLRKCQIKVTEYCDGHKTEDPTGFCSDSTATCGVMRESCQNGGAWAVPASCPYFSF